MHRETRHMQSMWAKGVSVFWGRLGLQGSPWGRGKKRGGWVGARVVAKSDFVDYVNQLRSEIKTLFFSPISNFFFIFC